MGLLLFEIRDQRAEAGVRRIVGHQLPSVPQGCAKIPCVARDRNQRHQHVPVRRMLPMRFVRDGHCLTGRAGRVQRDGIDISVARIVRGEFTGSAQEVSALG